MTSCDPDVKFIVIETHENTWWQMTLNGENDDNKSDNEWWQTFRWQRWIKFSAEPCWLMNHEAWFISHEPITWNWTLGKIWDNLKIRRINPDSKWNDLHNTKSINVYLRIKSYVRLNKLDQILEDKYCKTLTVTLRELILGCPSDHIDQNWNFENSNFRDHT